jgi:putative peptide zinc metalloprotease protein
VIFIGIALLIYFKVTKLLGVFLAAIEIYWFILKPVIKEVNYWWGKRRLYIGNACAQKTIALTLILVVIFIVPLPYPIKSAVVIRPTNFWDMMLTQRAQVVSLPPQDGEPLDAGASVGRFASDEASYRLVIANIREVEAQRNLRNANISRDTEESYAVLLSRYEGEVSSRQSAELLGDRLDLVAPVDAIFRRQDANLALGEWMPQLTRIGFIVPDRGTVDAVAWLEADAVASISIGSPVRIFTMQSVMPWRGQVIAMSDSAASELPVAALSAAHFGNVLVRPHNGVLVPEQAVYRVTIRVEGVESDDLRHVMYGNVAIRSAPRSMGERYVRAIVATLAREFTP